MRRRFGRTLRYDMRPRPRLVPGAGRRALWLILCFAVSLLVARSLFLAVVH